MSLHEKVLALENRIIDWLTAITWWIELRFGKDNVDVALGVDKLQVALMGYMFLMLGYLAYKMGSMFFLFLATIISSCYLLTILRLTFMGEAVRIKHISQFPQGCPNPCRILKPVIRARRFSILSVVFVALLAGSEVVVDDESFMFGVIVVIVFLIKSLFYFLLSCDSFPPEEKAARRLKNEMSKRQPIPST